MAKASEPRPALDRYTTMGDLTANVRRMVRRYLVLVLAGLGLETFFLFYTGSPAALGFAFMAIGAFAALAIWSYNGIGVPLLPMYVLQALIIYGLPIATSHDTIFEYPPEFLNKAGLEVLTFSLALAFAWRIGMQLISPSRGTAYVLQGIDTGGIGGLTRMGFGLVGIATSYLVLESLGWAGIILDLLPAGSRPIIFAAVSACSYCGFFLLAMINGAAGLATAGRLVFWTLLVVNCLISASSFLLSAAFGVIASVAIGLFWSAGRIPWRYVIITAFLISFFNTGKYEMRGRYWETEDEDAARPTGLAALPTTYSEWTQRSWEAMIGGEEDAPHPGANKGTKKKEQGLLQRLNNLQNILFVIDAMDEGHVPELGGQTYALIPPLLIPRILWPSKPRTHEGQVLLNVHFGRQALESTFKTYVAWGILPEAYGNFGSIKGAIIIGVFLGLLFAWAENITVRKPLLSTEGFVSFVIFLGLANSFEMVSSVLVTALFQAIVPVVVACSPFVRRQTLKRPEAPATLSPGAPATTTKTPSA